ncbi:unnamed protein product [Auanema sp. JU1783]|nr:unnamed protein product [Auanema sp. JU1783]
MNVSSIAPATSNGYVKYQIKTSGMPRILAEDTDVFTLDDQEDDQRDIERNQLPVKEEEKSRLFDCPLDSDDEKEENHRAPEDNRQNTRSHQAVGSQKECSRLTDSFDHDGDSLSDELDLLPPMPGAPNANSSWLNKFQRLNCCNPRIPNKCIIQ